MVREGLVSVLNREPNITVVAEAATGYETIALASKSGCHVVVMDVSLPDLNGIEATRRILKDNPHLKVVGLTAHSSTHYMTEMLQAGASAYLLKRSAAEDLVRAVRLVVEGSTYLSPEVAANLVESHVRPRAPVTPGTTLGGLTPREREMLQLIAEGKTTKEMADSLHVSVKTIETHRRNVMQKLHLHSIAELTKCAVREGLTSVDF
jgi:DNA-binding NarL/FixJ family response regulator